MFWALCEPLVEPVVQLGFQSRKEGLVPAAVADLLGSTEDRLDSLLDVGVVPIDLAGLLVGVELDASQPHAGDQKSRESPAERPRGERSDGQGLDVIVERGVVVLEPLVMGEISGPGPVVDRED